MRKEMFIDICKKTQTELKKYLENEMAEFGFDVFSGDGFLYAKGNLPILLTAHMDTVHKHNVQTVIERKVDGKTVITSPQGIGGDDRCGIYMILQILAETNLRPSILFCEDEEIGGVGSDKFTRSEHIKDLTEMRYLIELDRANAKDAVFYDCDNPEFTEYITETTGYKESSGSFSDISNLSPVCGIASVNLSCGYYKAHTTDEYVVLSEMENTIKVVEKLLADESDVSFEFIERKWESSYGRFGGYSYYDDYVGYSYPTERNFGKQICMEIFTDDDETFVEYGYSEYEVWGKFFINHPNIAFDDVIDYDMYTL